MEKTTNPPLLETVLLEAAQAMDDWITTYAAEHCSEEQVAAAWKRIMEHGGTLSYASTLRIKLQYIAGVKLSEAELAVLNES